MEFLTNYALELVSITNAMAPYLLLGFLFAGILHVYFPKDKVDKYLGKNNIKSVVNAAVLGVPLPLCSCGVIPTGVSFYKNGASKGSSVSFLISTPQTGVDSVLVTYSLLGLPFALIRPVIAFATGILGGFFTNLFDKDSNETDKKTGRESTNVSVNTSGSSLLLKPVPSMAMSAVSPMLNPVATEDDNCDGSCCSSDASSEAGIKQTNKLKIMFDYAFVTFLQDIAKWLILGLFAAAFISVVVPESFFTMYLGNQYLSMLIVLIASIPLYVCATSSVPIAAVLLAKGLSPGAALVFLMAGPATNAATITVIGKVLGKKTLIIYLASIISGALIFGTIINNFLPANWFLLSNLTTHAGGHEAHGILPFWFKALSSIVLLLLIINGFVKRKMDSRKSRINTSNEKDLNSKNDNLKNSKEDNKGSNKENKMNEQTINIKGMTCNHCKMNVEKNLSALEGIDTVNVDLNTNTAKLSGNNIDLTKVKETIDSIGYEYIAK